MQKFVLIVLLVMVSFSSFAAEKISVLVSDFKPNVYSNGYYKGFEVDLLTEMGFVPEFKSVSIKEIFSTTNYDMAIGALSITSQREELYDFSHPYQNSGLKAAIVGKQDISFWQSVASFGYPKALAKALSNKMFWEMGFWFATFIFGFSVIIWFTQRGHPDLDSNPIKGIPQAIYFCLVTASTVGYGDITLKNFAGRVCVLLLILCGISFFCNFTGMLSAEYNLQREKYAIESFTDLKGMKVAVMDGSTGEQRSKENGARCVSYETFEKCMEELRKGKVDAVVYDGPAIDHEAKNDSNIVALGPFNQEDYGFVFPKDSPLRETVNKKILSMKESGKYEEIKKRWF